MTQTLFNTQAMILSRALATAAEFMSEELARYLLTVKLGPVDESRANELAAKAREGSLSANEQAEIDEYLRVGRVMEILRIRARKTLGRKA
jgi:hypothetical protein